MAHLKTVLGADVQYLIHGTAASSNDSRLQDVTRDRPPTAPVWDETLGERLSDYEPTNYSPYLRITGVKIFMMPDSEFYLDEETLTLRLPQLHNDGWQIAIESVNSQTQEIVLNAFELMKNMIANGASGVHFEDQLASAKKCGHLGGKVLVPTQEFITKLVAARLAADVCGVPTILVARTDADAAKLITSDIDERDKAFIIDNNCSSEGFYYVKNGVEAAIARGRAYAPYADLVWCETSRPDLKEAKRFAEGIKAEYPDKLLAYNCSPSFNWQKNLDDRTIAGFQDKLSEFGYKYQFITLAGIHNMWFNMFDLAYDYARGEGMKHYTEMVQEPEFAAREKGYTFVSHQQEVGAGYFDDVTTVIQGGTSSVTALSGSTEEEQFG